MTVECAQSEISAVIRRKTKRKVKQNKEEAEGFEVRTIAEI